MCIFLSIVSSSLRTALSSQQSSILEARHYNRAFTNLFCPSILLNLLTCWSASDRTEPTRSFREDGVVLLLASIGCMGISGFGAFLTGADPRKCSILSAIMAVIAGTLGIIPCIQILAGGQEVFFEFPWEMPFSSFSLHLDSLSAFFLLPIFGLGLLTAVFGSGYLLNPHEKMHGFSWLCFNSLWASMVLVVIAADALLFMLAWELTVLASFFLVVLGGKGHSNCRAGWVYLIASHLGAGFLIVLFLLLGRETGSLNFASFAGAGSLPEFTRGCLFLLALIGFGTKAGFIPLHVWLPEAHPAAPSHVSALMSGVMIKTGIYGLVRILFFLGTPAWWWGWTLLVVGLTSGILGVLFAISQHDLKRLLAYHSVENIGIIAIGLGIGLLGLSWHNSFVAIIGFSGGLLHVLNHAVFKGLLFLGSGAVLVKTGTREIDHLGGLLKKMPWTAAAFLTGCVSISGLPPFNGFISEFLIYMAAFHAVLYGTSALTAPGMLVILGLSLIGGLAAACFAKAFSVVFLGTARSQAADQASEVGPAMKWPMVILALLCLIISLSSPLILEIPERILKIHPWFAMESDFRGIFHLAEKPLLQVTYGALALLGLILLAAMTRQWLLSKREKGLTVTWGCGYSHPSATMQYTGSSFAQPLTGLFQPILRTGSHIEGTSGHFPVKASFKSHTDDVFETRMFFPLFRFVSNSLFKIVWIQNGVVQLSVLLIAVTLLILLIVGLLLP
mgnify:FL=1